MRYLSRSYIFIGVAILLGIGSGLTHQTEIIHTAGIISDLFMNLLKLITAPILFLSIFSTLLGIGDFKLMKTLGRKIFTYTLLTTGIAAGVALVLFLVLDPAKAAIATDAIHVSSVGTQASYSTFVLKIIPANFVEAFLENNVIGIAFIGFLFGIASLRLSKESREPLYNFFSSLFKLVLRVTDLIVLMMPIGIWAFVTILIGEIEKNSSQFHHIMLYLGVVLGANLIQGFLVLPLLLKSKGIPPFQTAKGAAKAIVLAFFSKSSNATLPISMQCAEKNLGMSSKVVHFSLPLCTVINMNGCAAFILTTVLFVSEMHGISFSPLHLTFWVLLATLAAIGNAGVPMGCFFLSSAFLIAMGVPLIWMGILLPFYAFLDMVETALNVWSDIAVTAIVDQEIRQESTLYA